MKNVVMSSVDELFGPMAAAPDGSEVLAALNAAARERILILDGAMGTQIQGLGFDEDHFRGDRSAAVPATSRATTTS